MRGIANNDEPKTIEVAGSRACGRHAVFMDDAGFRLSPLLCSRRAHPENFGLRSCQSRHHSLFLWRSRVPGGLRVGSVNSAIHPCSGDRKAGRPVLAAWRRNSLCLGKFRLRGIPLYATRPTRFRFQLPSMGSGGQSAADALLLWGDDISCSTGRCTPDTEAYREQTGAILIPGPRIRRVLSIFLLVNGGLLSWPQDIHGQGFFSWPRE
jgi:hypothetical protein